jgi:hypothetical protein
MQSPEVFRSTMLRLDRLLERIGIRYHLTGGMASIAYGDPRTTQDLDVVVDQAAIEPRFEEFVAGVAHEGFMIEQEVARDAVSRGAMFKLLDRREIVKVDLYPRELVPGELGRSARLEVFEGLLLPVASRLDAAASKLRWIEMGSHRSRRDLRRMFDEMTDADRLGLGVMASELGLSPLLGEVLIEPDEPPADQRP